MKKLLRPGELLKLGLAEAFDFYQEIQDPLDLGKWLSYNYHRRNFAATVKREIKTGDIEKIEKNGEIYLRLTTRGKNKIIRDFPLLFLANKKWDGKWRVVIYDIAEVSKNIRENLRRKLHELGFGMIQESVWISPHDITADFTEYLESKKLTEMVYMFEARKLVAGDEKELAQKVWSLDDMNAQYLKLYARAIHGGRHIQSVDKKIRSEYLEILMRDPLLPKELLPDDWMGEKVKKLIKCLK
ncbi:MAG: PaaX family transcriptional regulator C-terminal domain-containing protein [bacterium]|nr:PaaX family transcriptional regulator C-terminal domain-containing protein [bacterium]